MIAVDCRGRLGNHLFQYAFGMAASRRLRTSFVMADERLRELFTLGPYRRPLGRLRRSLVYRVDARVRPYPVVKLDNSELRSPTDMMATVRDHALYTGFFQSEWFFDDVRDSVRAAFTPRPRHVAAFEARYGSLLEQPYVCCHVRRTDYLTWLDGIALPVSYYADALRELQLSPQTPIVFVGDDLSELHRAFGFMPEVRFEHNAEIVDLQLIMRADAVVSSNSSFSWWGAWLGREGRPVIAPRHWLGFKEGAEYPPSVVPDSWTQLSVRSPPTGASRPPPRRV